MTDHDQSSERSAHGTRFTVTTLTGDDTRELRRVVLRPHLPPGSPMPGDGPDVVHIGALDTLNSGALASTCVIFAEPWPGPELPEVDASTGWRLRGMATDPALRGAGAGAAVLIGAQDYARERSCQVLWCQARESAVGFYLRAGWQGVGELFATEIGPHLLMYRTL